MDCEPPSEAFVARCLLGAGWVAGKRKLSMHDLRVWAALLSQLGAQLRAELPDDPTLGHADTRTVETTAYQLANRVWGDDGGKAYRLLRRSLMRLQAAAITVRAVDADPELAVERILEGSVSLIGDVWTATTRLDLTTPREWGALKASTSLKVEIGRWPAQQVHAGRCSISIFSVRSGRDWHRGRGLVLRDGHGGHSSRSTAVRKLRSDSAHPRSSR